MTEWLSSDYMTFTARLPSPRGGFWRLSVEQLPGNGGWDWVVWQTGYLDSRNGQADTLWRAKTDALQAAQALISAAVPLASTG